MTSVQNLLPQLNGNRFILFFLCLFFMVSSCDALRKAQSTDTVNNPKKEKEELDEIQGQRKYNPETGEYEYSTEVVSEMDTVKWKVNSPSDYPPINSEGKVYTKETGQPTNTSGESIRLGSYNVAIMLPFLTDKFNYDYGTVDPKSELAINYYFGCKMAFDELSREGVNLNVSVLDTKADEGEVRSLLGRSDVMNANMLIGPVKKSNLKIVADWAKQNKKPLISPISASSSVTSDNPYYIQVAPSLESHCKAITQHVRKQYATDQVVLVVRNKKAETARLRYFQEANYEISASKIQRFKEFIINNYSADNAEIDILPHIIQGDTTVFVLPSWSNESFIYSFLRQLELVKGRNHVVVYGMPQWMEYKKVSFDYFEKLNVHVSTNNFVNRNNYEAKEFRKNFFNKYGSIPSNDAYLGYDVMRYFGRQLAKNGTRFQETLDVNNENYLHTRFEFQREVPSSGVNVENYSLTDRFENKYVNILEFKNYEFQLAE